MPEPWWWDWMPLWISLQVGLAATALAMGLGAPLGWLLSSRKYRAGRFLESLVLLPLVLPPTVLGYFLLVLIGANGPVGEVWEAVFGVPLVFTKTAAIIAAAVVTIPIVVIQLSAAFSQIDPDVTEAAHIDGATGFALFRLVHLPQVRRPAISAAMIAFARALGDFGTTLMVAGSIPGHTQTASLAIFDRVIAGETQQALGLVIAISAVAFLTLTLARWRAV